MKQDACIIMEARGLCKHFSGVQALDQVDIVLKKGKITALIGENGAGKSTLVKILSGVYQPDRGELFLDGRPVVLESVLQAQQKGISVIHQVPSFAPDLSVVDNVFLGRELSRAGKNPAGAKALSLLDRKAETERLMPLLQIYGGEIDPLAAMKTLKAYQQRLTGIIKALVFSARVLIMDEPTAALPLGERELLLSRILQLRDEGYTILYVSHHLDEIEKVADEITALRDGKPAGSRESIPSQAEMIGMMTGKNLKGLEDLYGRGKKSAAGDEALQPDRQFFLDWEPRPEGPSLFQEPLSLEFLPGRITLLTGLVGSGVKEIAEALFGANPRCRVQTSLGGRTIHLKDPKTAIENSLGYLSDDRLGEAVVPDFTIRENLTLPRLNKVARAWGHILVRQETRAAEELCSRLHVKMSSLKQKILELSGGNQQKVMLARWLFSEVQFLILNEPTQGIDVPAKKEVMDLLFSFAAAGGSCVIATNDPEEFLTSADRVIVMRKGKIAGDFSAPHITREAVFSAMLIHQTQGGEK